MIAAINSANTIAKPAPLPTWRIISSLATIESADEIVSPMPMQPYVDSRIAHSLSYARWLQYAISPSSRRTRSTI
jgi:hypothetical protein